MTARLRPYHWPADYEAVRSFLLDNYLPGNRDGNWMPSRWDYMHTHPSLDRSTLGQIGLWEEDGRIVAVANHEDSPGTVYCQFAPEHHHLAPDVVAYAEQSLRGRGADGSEILRIYACEGATELAAALVSRGFALDGRHEGTSAMEIRGQVAAATVPEGFRVLSLADEDDLVKVNRVLWRGFNHPGEPPAEGLPGRAQAQSGPHFRHDLNIVVKAPNGEYATYAGAWYEPQNHTACVEPVATDPTYRRLGLGRAAVLEGIRRCVAEGAEIAFVGSEQPFYLALGFRPILRHLRWTKHFA